MWPPPKQGFEFEGSSSTSPPACLCPRRFGRSPRFNRTATRTPHILQVVDEIAFCAKQGMVEIDQESPCASETGCRWCTAEVGRTSVYKMTSMKADLSSSNPARFSLPPRLWHFTIIIWPPHLVDYFSVSLVASACDL